MLRVIPFAVVAWLWTGLVVASAGLPDEQRKRQMAEDVANEFYDAMQDGDVDEVRDLLTGRYASRKQGVLATPGYASQLRRLMDGKRFALHSVELTGLKSARVLGVIVGTTGDQRDVHLLLSLVEQADEWVYRVSGEVTTSRL